MEIKKSKHEVKQLGEAFNLLSDLINSRITENQKNNDYEEIDIRNSKKRICFEDIISNINIPSKPTSLMDGYAINTKDFHNIVKEFHKEKIFQETSKVFAGDNSDTINCNLTSRHELPSAVYVTTGSTIPEYFDCVVPIENIGLLENRNSNRSNQLIEILQTALIETNKFIRSPGMNIKLGEVVVSKGKSIDPIDIGLLASIGVSKIKVYKSFKVAIMSNGDELEDLFNPSMKSTSFIYDSNKIVIKELIKSNFPNVELIDLGINKDDIKVVSNKFEQASKECKILISTGGMSMGDKDYVKKFLEDDEYSKILFGRINIKPGMPTSLATYKDMIVFGLSGNPVSCVVGYYLLTFPSIRSLSYNSPIESNNIHTMIKAISLNHYDITSDRPELIRVKLYNANSYFYAESTTMNQLSSTLKSCRDFNGLLCLPSSKDKTVINPNDELQAILLEPSKIEFINECKLKEIKSRIKASSQNVTYDCCCGNKQLPRVINTNIKNEPYKVGLVVLTDKLFEGKYEKNLPLEYFKQFFQDKENYKHAYDCVIPNDRDKLVSVLNYESHDLDVIFTSGGTGLTNKDIVPETTKSILDKETPGITHLIMSESINIKKIACLSRLVTGIKNKCLVINLPGNPKAVKEILVILDDILSHAINQLRSTNDFH